jgi:hypothetical protein
VKTLQAGHIVQSGLLLHLPEGFLPVSFLPMHFIIILQDIFEQLLVSVFLQTSFMAARKVLISVRKIEKGRSNMSAFIFIR